MDSMEKRYWNFVTNGSLSVILATSDSCDVVAMIGGWDELRSRIGSGIFASTSARIAIGGGGSSRGPA
ncbi:hypothetical protein KCP77_20315 [Salmonella enterica subsp. enterica]|nr:hypothetical protein KCP77_20315 [Salmonella enterica subsp. enterica]